jgi:hypothetical protein
MSFYNQLVKTVFLASICLFFLIAFVYIQNKIDIFLYKKFKPEFSSFPLENITITKSEMEKIHLLYNYLAIVAGIFGILFTLFICELIELFRSYRKRNLASVAS